MFIVGTYVAPSEIHGMGCFAAEDLSAGEPIWQFAPGLDLVVPFKQIAAAPKAFRDYMEMYAYVSPQVEGGMVLSCDHAKFLNHSDNPNTDIRGETTFARSDIKKGEEITCDYRICCADFSGAF
jgi:SET domain-containing protein